MVFDDILNYSRSNKPIDVKIQSKFLYKVKKKFKEKELIIKKVIIIFQ